MSNLTQRGHDDRIVDIVGNLVSPDTRLIADLADRLVYASRADASGWAAGTAGAAARHDHLRVEFRRAVEQARTATLADAFFALAQIIRIADDIKTAAAMAVLQGAKDV